MEKQEGIKGITIDDTPATYIQTNKMRGVFYQNDGKEIEMILTVQRYNLEAKVFLKSEEFELTFDLKGNIEDQTQQVLLIQANINKYMLDHRQPIGHRIKDLVHAVCEGD